MAWSWSHTADAYAAAESNLRRLDEETLRVIYAEWVAYLETPGEGHWSDVYAAALAAAQNIPVDTLCDSIWEKASEHAICENGGHRAWVCPYGCHTVSFSEGK